ncbi:MAG: glycosyltransferase family 4 protein [Acidobacteria bacterium]|nr:glycosyltransferase family 4 protein [Acidobacteriota bacterium]MBI3657912.1 glycosyltransferase family 4 protein [Acidobacteriota bacterium]
MRIGVIVHGRFHAFDLVRELLQRGHDVSLFTNYPKFAVRRFGVADANIHSFRLHGVLNRLVDQLPVKRESARAESWLHTVFGRWAASQALARGPWDAVVCWSGVGEETFQALSRRNTLLICHRSSSHIRAQASLLREEEERVGWPIERPTDWIIAREEREYALADVIYVPSTFSEQTFLSLGISPGRVARIPHGVSAKAFRPESDVVQERRARILSGAPLHVLNVGTFSFRKGMWDMSAIIRKVGRRFRFRFVGPVAAECAGLAEELRDQATFIGPQAQQDLPRYYAWGDMFLLPTIEDGFPFVLAQAAAAGLPILTTPNGAGGDLVCEGKTGWVLPIRSPLAFIERLHWCDTHREELAAMTEHIHTHFQLHDWTDTARSFEALCETRLAARKQSRFQVSNG